MAVATATSVVLTTVMFASVASATPSSFLELDGNVLSGTNTNAVGGPYDWANGGTLSTTSGTVSVSGGGGVFNGGHFNGATTPPTAPPVTATAASDPGIADAEFKVDPLSVDHTACGTGDPTAYTGAGSETNGDLLSSDTFGTASVPNKDDLSNVYALAHINPTTNEVFFGGERVVNSGDSHIDYEFLQSAVTIPAACSGSFTGSRTEGDFLLSVDFTSGGTFGDTILYQWHCNADPTATSSGPQPPDGTVCNPPLHGQSVPHYQQVGTTAVTIRVNGTGSVSCGGWVCRNADGTQATSLTQNELMEGGIDLKQLGFTGCVSTFLPHTRSSQSFTATLKDFEIIPFNTCAHPTISTQVKNASDNSNISNGGHVAIGTSVYDTASLTNATTSAGGSVNYKLYSDSSCTTLATDPALNQNVTVTNAAVPNSSTITFNHAGTFYFQATYSGDSRNIVPTGGAKSACSSEVVVVDKNSPTISTQVKLASDNSNVANGGHVSIGTSVYDTASLSGATAGAGGSVTYKLFSDSACSTLSTSPALNQTVTVTNGSVPNSNSVTFANAGTYYFQASYTGDGDNNGPVSSACNSEVVVVDQNTPTIATQVKRTSDDSNVSNSGHLALGAQVYDTASLTGATSTAGGTVTYKLFSDSACTTLSTAPALNQTVTVSNASVPSSNSVTFNNAGTYYFQATYSGDSNNAGPVSSACNSEIVIVDKNTPVPDSIPVVQIKDTLHVTGLSSDASGSVTVGLYTSSDCTTGQVGSNQLFAASGAVGGTLTAETTFVGVLAGTYYYKISYPGDGNNNSFSSCAENVGVTIQSLTHP